MRPKSSLLHNIKSVPLVLTGNIGDVRCHRFSDAVEAGDAVPFGFALAIAFGIFEAASCCKGQAGNAGVAFNSADFRSVANEADESSSILHDFDLSKLVIGSRDYPFD